MVEKKCSVGGCDRGVLAKGLCGSHYRRKRKFGDVCEDWPIGDRSGVRNSRWRGGATTHPLYDIYHDMLARCSRETHNRYADYGGRGIQVHPEWVEDFWKFVGDVGERPKGETEGGKAYWQLDRIDNDGNYEPENVRWATPEQQAVNKRGFGDYESRRDPLTGRFR